MIFNSSKHFTGTFHMNDLYVGIVDFQSSGTADKHDMRPWRAASRAIAYPILPVEKLPIYRTGSMRSRVGPAVIRTHFPASNPFRIPAETSSRVRQLSLPVPPSVPFRQSACKFSAFGIDQRYTIGGQSCQIPLRCRMNHHVEIHRRRGENLSACRQIAGYKHIVGNACGHLGQGAGRGRAIIMASAHRPRSTCECHSPVFAVKNSLMTGRPERTDRVTGV